jgi:EpsI family protein
MALPFRSWTAADQPLPPGELSPPPDASLLRRYRSPAGETAELAVIAGHRQDTIHSPVICMSGAGWEWLAQRHCALELPGGRLPVTRALLIKDGERLLITYCFTDGAHVSANLIRFQFSELLERLQSRTPVGALVRVLVPVAGDAAAAERTSDDLLRAALPAILERLRRAGVTG